MLENVYKKYVEMRISVKNNADAIIFQCSHVSWLFVPQASQTAIITGSNLIFGTYFLRH